MREQIASIPIKDLTDDEWSRLFVVSREVLLKPACEALGITNAEAEALSQQELYRRIALQGERLLFEYPFNMALSILEEESPFKYPVEVSGNLLELDVVDKLGEQEHHLNASVTQWLDESYEGKWKFGSFMSEEQEYTDGSETKRGRKVTYVVKFKDENDAVMFMMHWI